MKKAMMYLLLALGITLVVMFIGGAMVGLIAGFIDGFSGNQVGTTTSKSVMVYAGSVSLILLCIILNWVYIKLGFASYTIGCAPKIARWKVYACVIPVFACLAILNNAMPSQELELGYSVQESYDWMRSHFLFSIVVIAIVEATGNLIIYGAVLREILDWKHRPIIIIPIFAAIMGFISVIVTHSPFALIGFLVAWVEGWIYEYSRSVIPVIIGDVVYWIIVLSMIGTSWEWLAFLPFIVALPAYLYAIKALEPTKPID
ncbi:MAG: hypothetical protein E7102_07000 [Prevotella ruminicola]|uniref:Uncharacterized protein n=1 Tax=Xylanibacter ruminicola TaxID=839 RepID=A0A928BT15_XYLRU|nr:hypothetical protein [Xylanibacter ruminicola]